MFKSLVIAMLAVVSLGLAAIQELPEDYPGQRGHGKPPDGWFCSHTDPNPAKACSCNRVDKSHDCDEPGSIIEDRACKVYCHKQHCHCQPKCDHPDHKPGEGPEDKPMEHDDHE